jgi:phage terminase Nu1 subunit (DNA packaging protein)
MQTVTKWEREGLPIAERGRRGQASRYDLVAVRAWRSAKEHNGNGSGSSFQRYQDAHARQRSALAEIAELQLAERKGRLVDGNMVERTWSNCIIRMRTKLLGVPSKVKQLHSAVDNRVFVDVNACICEALEELATEGER